MHKNFELEAEGVGIWGSIGNVNWDPTATAVSASIRQGAGVLRGKAKLGEGGRFAVGGEFGIASGDSAPGFGNFPGRCNLSLAATDPLRCNQMALPGSFDGQQYSAIAAQDSSPSINNYRFNPAYQVDLILWRRLIGTVTDAWYLKPTFRWDILDGLNVGAQVVYSQAITATSTPSGTSTPLGVELDLGVKYQSDDGFVFFLDYGLLKLLSGFNMTTTVSGISATTTPSGVAQNIHAGLGNRLLGRDRLPAARDDGPHLEGGLGLDGPLHRALVRDPDQRVPVLLGERGRHLDVEVHPGERAVVRVAQALDDPDPVERQVALLAEADHEDPGAGSHRRSEEREGRGVLVAAASLDRLVGPDDVATDLRVHPLAAGKGDDDLLFACHVRPPLVGNSGPHRGRTSPSEPSGRVGVRGAEAGAGHCGSLRGR